MNSFKIRFSDVIRYFILGWIEFLLYIAIVDREAFNTVFGDGVTSYTALQIAIVFVGIYLLGFVTQSIIQLFYGGDFLGTGIGEVAEYIRFYPTRFWNSRDYPDWVYWSDSPRRVLDIYRDILETDDNAENKTEFLFSNQLFQGTAFAILTVTLYKYICNFNCLYGVGKCLVMLLILGLIWFVHWHSGQSKKIRFTVILGHAMFLVVLFLGRAGSSDCSWITGMTLAVSYILTYWLANSLARKQIRRVDILAKYNNDETKVERFKRVLTRVGVPKFYILTRTNSEKYITDELDSICIQNYPNIKVIVLLDSSLNKTKSKRNKLINIIDFYRKDKKLNIQTYESANTGPAALSNEIRQIYLNYAKPDDLAMMLDSDDKLYSPSVVTQIVTKMYSTQSNICLISFEIFGKRNLNYSKNHHNELVRELNYDISTIRRVKCYFKKIFKKGIVALTKNKKTVAGPNNMNHNNEKVQDLSDVVVRTSYYTPDNKRISRPNDISYDEMHRISTIGWTKCYRKEILDAYHNMANKYLKINEKRIKNLNISKYEDFPDIVALLQKEARICTVAKNSVLFRKSGDSVTTLVSRNNYDIQIPFFLAMAKELADDNKKFLIDGGGDIVEKGFLPYKFIQYLNIVYKKTQPGDNYDKNLEENGKPYSCDLFYKSCVEMFFKIDISEGKVSDKDSTTLSAFHRSIEVVVGSYDYDILGDFPDKVERNSKWENIRTAYGLTKTVGRDGREI